MDNCVDNVDCNPTVILKLCKQRGFDKQIFIAYNKRWVIIVNKKDLDRIKDSILGDFFYYESIGSTNDEALRNAESEDKSLFLTEKQTDGRGRGGRRWEASKGGIYMTVLLKPKNITADFSALTLAVGLAVARAIPNSQIKWPNDIILDGKKVAGILTETRLSDKTAVIAVGIGINANNTEFSKEIGDKATSIRLFSGEIQDTAELVIRVYNEFLRVYESFLKGFDEIKDEYIVKCVTLNREIVVISGIEERKMYAVGINDKGELLAECDGKTEEVNFGDVSVRGIMGYS